MCFFRRCGDSVGAEKASESLRRRTEVDLRKSRASRSFTSSQPRSGALPAQTCSGAHGGLSADCPKAAVIACPVLAPSLPPLFLPPLLSHHGQLRAHSWDETVHASSRLAHAQRQGGQEAPWEGVAGPGLPARQVRGLADKGRLHVPWYVCPLRTWGVADVPSTSTAEDSAQAFPLSLGVLF